MPTVPVYDAPQIASQPISPMQVNPNVQGMGTGLSQGLNQLGANADQVVDQVAESSQKANTAASTDGLTKLQGSVNNALYDPQNGLMHKEGEAAVAASDGVYANIIKDRQAIADQYLTNDSQREMFLRQSAAVLQDVHRTVENHVGQQIHVANQATLQARMETGLMAVANNYTDAQTAAQQIASVEGPARTLQLSKEAGDATLMQFRQKVAETRLTQAIANKDVAWATSYFAQAKTELGPAAAQYEHTLQQLQGQVSGRTTAMSMLKVATNPESGLVDEAKLNEALGQLPPDYPHFKDVQEALVPLREQAERANKGLVNQNFVQAFGVLEQDHSLSNVPAATKSWLIQFAPEKWNELETKQHELTVRGRRDENQANSADESAAYGDALKDLNDNRFDWINRTPDDLKSKYGTRLSPKDFRALTVHFSGLKQGNNLDRLPAPEAAALQRVFQDELKLPPSQSKWDPKMLDTFHKVLDQVTVWRASEIRKHKGAEPTQEQLDTQTHQLLVKQPVAGTGFNVLGTTFFQKEVPAVDTAPPADFVKDVSERFRKAKAREPTQDEIRTLFQKQQARQKAP